MKILDTDTEEAAICEKLQANLKSPNHIIPAEVIRSPSEPPILLMPCLSTTGTVSFHTEPLSFLLSFFYQIAEVYVEHYAYDILAKMDAQGVEYLHDHRIAHLVRVND